MGIIKSIVEFVATDAILEATDIAIKGIDKASDAVQKRTDKKIQKFLDTNPDHCHLFVSQVRYQLKETYYIYDQNQQVRYMVKGELLSKKPSLHHFLRPKRCA